MDREPTLWRSVQVESQVPFWSFSANQKLQRLYGWKHVKIKYQNFSRFLLQQIWRSFKLLCKHVRIYCKQKSSKFRTVLQKRLKDHKTFWSHLRGSPCLEISIREPMLKNSTSIRQKRCYIFRSIKTSTPTVLMVNYVFSAGQHILHSGVQLHDLQSRAFDEPWLDWITSFHSDRSLIQGSNTWKMVFGSKVSYSRKMDLLSAFGFLLAANYVAWYKQIIHWYIHANLHHQCWVYRPHVVQWLVHPRYVILSSMASIGSRSRAAAGYSCTVD